jgi:hypothetical protein
MSYKLNIIRGNRTERHERLGREIATQGILVELWDGIYLPSVKASINAAHKQIVQYAKIAEWEQVMIAEDDIRFSAPRAWDYYLYNMPKDFDLYLGGVFLGEPEAGIVKDFTGMTLYTVHQRYYDTFLAVPDDEHIDRALSAAGGLFRVCEPFVCFQYDGHSTNTGKWESYESLIKNRRFFGQ